MEPNTNPQHAFVTPALETDECLVSSAKVLNFDSLSEILTTQKANNKVNNDTQTKGAAKSSESGEQRAGPDGGEKDQQKEESENASKEPKSGDLN
jgi:hypothetical protein